MITTMLLDYPPLKAGQEVEFIEWLPGDAVGIRDMDGNVYQVDASHVSGNFYRKSKGGRPTLSDEANVKVEIVMPFSLRDKLDRLADGNRSAWIRAQIETAKESTMKCEHCGQKGNIAKVEIEDGFVYLCGACRGDARTTEYNERKAKPASK